VTRRRSVWLALAASTLAHGAFAWQLARAPRRVPRASARDTFEVRMVSLPPAPTTPPSEPPPPEPEPPKPKPKPKPEVAPPKPLPEPPRAATEDPAVPEPSTAAPALLAGSESGSALGTIVQLAGAPIGALATTAAPLLPPAPAASPEPQAARLSKLADLSRKPRAPSLDAALRDNYPAELRRRGTEGQAEVRVVIDPGGRVGDIAVVSETAQGFAEACRRTLLGSRWSEPIDRDGQPVSTRLTYRCRFQIER
jgi:protein TonB